MRRIVRFLQRALVGSLEAIVLARAHRHVKSFARHILQTATARAVETWPPQWLAVTTAVTHAQATVLPQLAFRAKAIRRVNVSTEATRADRTHPGHRAQQFDLRESL